MNNKEFKRELNLKLERFAFIAGVYCGCTEGRYTITEDEAQYTIDAWKEENISLPIGFNAKEFAEMWNSMVEEGGATFA